MEHWYELLKTARIDRFDLLCEREFDRWQGEIVQLGEQARMTAEDEGVALHYNSRCLGASQDGQRRLYTFETWGEFSDKFAQVAGSARWVDLHRLDLRIEIPVNVEALLGLAGYVEQNGKFGRNVQYFSTREREKKEGRHAGGRGVSIGSHKSDRRLVVYKRKGEKGAIELQLSGKLLRNLVGHAKEQWDACNGSRSFYAIILDRVRPALEKMCREAGFESVAGLAASVAPDSTLEPPADFVAEAPVETLVQSFMSLNDDDRTAVITRVMGLHLSR